MFTDIETYLRYYEGLHKRTVRDFAALPPEAADYVPEQGEGENGWTIGEIARHVGGARLYFAKATVARVGFSTGRLARSTRRPTGFQCSKRRGKPTAPASLTRRPSS